MTEKLINCGDGGCRMPGAVRRYGGQHTNGGCRCTPEQLARAHEAMAAKYRAHPYHGKRVREEEEAIQRLAAEVQDLKLSLAEAQAGIVADVAVLKRVREWAEAEDRAAETRHNVGARVLEVLGSK